MHLIGWLFAFILRWHLFLVDQPVGKEWMHISLDPDPVLHLHVNLKRQRERQTERRGMKDSITRNVLAVSMLKMPRLLSSAQAERASGC